MNTNVATSRHPQWKDVLRRNTWGMATRFGHITLFFLLCFIVPTVTAAQRLSSTPRTSFQSTERIPATSTDSQADFRELMQRILTARETLDPANAAPYYAKDADNVFYDIAPLKYASWAEYVEAAKKVIGDFASQRLTRGDDVRVHLPST